MQNKNTGMVLVIIVGIVLAVLLLGGTGIIRFSVSSISPQMLYGIGTTISAIFLALVIGMDLLFVVLIARTPNMRWQP